MEGLPELNADERFAAAETELRVATEAVADIDRRLAEAQSKIATCEAELRALRNKVAAGEEGAREAATLAEDIAAWRLLSKGLGRDGIVALSIDDAGPSLSSMANDLLLACYGPRFSIRFDTQSAKADGSMREDFDIRVFDAESGSDKSVLKTSGGERIWINEALTRAIALFRAQQTGQQYHAIFSDESDGALDPERKLHYMEMKRRVLQLGGYEVEFFISHTPELQDQADQIIDVGAMRIAA
jgi:exonuclease SbcC